MSAIVLRRDILKTAMVSLLFSSNLVKAQQNHSQSITNSSCIFSDKRKIGHLEVSSIGLGCLPMVGYYGGAYEKQDMINLIRHAYELGITFFDTAEVYGPYISEEWVGEALNPIRDKVVIATKFGFGVEEGEPRKLNSNLQHIRRAVEGSLKRLKTDHIDLLYQHRVDPNVPIEQVASLMKELNKEGKILHWGMSEAGSGSIARAHKIFPLTAVQSEYAMWWREPDTKVLPLMRKLNIGLVAYCPMNRAITTGALNENTKFSPKDRRSTLPRFAPDAYKHNLQLLTIVKKYAAEAGCSPAQLTLKWVLEQGEDIVPIPGTTNPLHLAELAQTSNIAVGQDIWNAFENDYSKLEIIGHRAEPLTESQIDYTK